MLLIRPLPFHGESLSSWRQRAGMQNGFRRYPRPVGFSSAGEPDKYPKDEEMQWIYDEHRLGEQVVRSLCLDSIGLRFDSDFGKVVRRRWVIPAIGAIGLTSGGTCCPLCLRTDDTPYFRLQWRFAFMTHCPIHGCLLLDRCSNCSAPMWPASMRSLVKQPPTELSNCQACGAAICSEAKVDKEMQGMAHALWACASQGTIPDQMRQAADAREVFAAIWTMSQMLLRQRSTKIWNILPGSKVGPLEKWDGKRYIELLPVQLRSQVIRAAYWLLSDWPCNFAGAAAATKLQWTHFTPNRQLLPVWMARYIQQNLSVRIVGLSTESVREAIAALERDGVAVTKSSLRRVFAVTEAKAIHQLVPHRRRATIAEFTRLCGALEERLRDAPRARDQKATLNRDYLIFVLSVLADKRIESICGMSHDEVEVLMRQLQGRTEGGREEFQIAVQRAAELARYEEQFISERKVNYSGRFRARSGGPLAGHTVRERIAKIMKFTLDSDLWNSADAFLGLFSASIEHPSWLEN